MKRRKPADFVPLENLITKFKSESDLHKVISIDCKCYSLINYSGLFPLHLISAQFHFLDLYLAEKRK